MIASLSAFKTWKKIKLGTGLRTTTDFKNALEKANCLAENWSTDVISRASFRVRRSEKEVDLVFCSNSELGFGDGALLRDIYKRAKSLGLGSARPKSALNCGCGIWTNQKANGS